MAKKISTRKPHVAKAVSHANNKTNKRQNVNMQKVTINGTTVVTSVREARTFKKNK